LRRGGLESGLASLEPDAHGLTVLPFLAGERSPGWADAARAAIAGVTAETTPLQIARAMLEAVALRFGVVADLLRSAIEEDAVFVASGGAILGSPAWLQIMADVLGRSVIASTARE